MMRGLWFVATREIGFQMRDKETLLWVFLMPILFFYFIGTVTGGYGPPSPSTDPDPLVLEERSNVGPLREALALRLVEEGFRIHEPGPEDPPAKRRLVLPDPPPGFETLTAAVLAGQRAELAYEREGGGLRADFERFRVQRAIAGVVADLAVAVTRGREFDPALWQEIADRPRALRVEESSAGRRVFPPSGYAQTIPGTLVMSTMLILLTSGAIFLVIEREQGLLRRLAATPLSRTSIVLGKWTGKMALALVQISFAMLIGTLLFGMDWGASFPMVCVLLLAWGAFNASLGLTLACLVRSEGQMAALGVLCSLILAALGGCWWPIEITPDWMQRLALFLPTGWTMDAMHKIVNFGYGAETIVPHVVGLSVAALALGAVAVRTFRYE